MKAKTFMSIAAIATFVAITLPVHASIKYTPVNIVIPNGGSYSIDFNQDGIKDIYIGSFFTKNVFCGSRSAPGGSANLTPAQSTGGVILKGGFAAALPSGVSVGSSQSFAQRQTDLMFFHYCGGSLHSAGNWFDVSNHYLGMEFPINGQTYYGWAELSINGARGGLTTALMSFAYETIPGKAIKTGQTKYAADDPDIGSNSADPGDPGPTATAYGSFQTLHARNHPVKHLLGYARWRGSAKQPGTQTLALSSTSLLLDRPGGPHSSLYMLSINSRDQNRGRFDGLTEFQRSSCGRTAPLLT